MKAMDVKNKEKTPTGKKTTLEKAKKESRRRRLGGKVAAILGAVLLVGAALFLLYDKAFVIRHFVSSDGAYTEEECTHFAERLGLKTGEHLFSFDRSEARQTAVFALSEFDSVNIGYRLPDTVVFRLQKAEPSFYLAFENEYYVVSQGFRVLSRLTDKGKAEALGLPEVMLGGIEKCVAGEFLSCSDAYKEALERLTATMREENVWPQIDWIDLSDRFDVRFSYQGRFTVLFGSADNYPVKIRTFKSIADDQGPTANGYIDVSYAEQNVGSIKSYN